MKRTPGWQANRRAAGSEFAITIGLGLTILFFLISGATAYFNLRTIQRDNAEISHSHDVLASLSALRATALDAETGQRGYMLTGDVAYLAPYDNAIANMAPQLDTLAWQVKDNPQQVARIAPLRQHVAAKLAELKQTIALTQSGERAAAMAIIASNRGKIEMDDIRDLLGEMDQTEEVLRAQRLREMAAACQHAMASGIASGLVSIILALVVGALIRRATLMRQRQDWIQSAQVGLEAAMRGQPDAARLGESILAFMSSYFGAVAGVLYVADEDGFTRTASYGVPASAFLPARIAPHDGLLGEAVARNEHIVLERVPEGYLTFGTALGQRSPSQLIVVPGSIEGVANMVLELGFIQPVDAEVVALLDKLSAAIAMVVRATRYRDELKALLAETQQKSEELQVQGEELRVSNEELEEQSRALKESQARLEQQQAELEQGNARLEEQTQLLESQRDELEKANGFIQLKARELEQASRYKSDFLANMSHELRTPLNSLLILAKLLADNPTNTLTGEQVKYAQTIQSSGNDLLTLINDILDLSKIEAGHVEIQPDNVKLERIATHLRQMFEPIARERRLGLVIEAAPDAPASMVTDSQRLEQVLKNLLSNALKFTEAGEVRLTIQRAGGGRVAFAVSDTGIGISEEQQAHIFDAFHQADGTISRKYGGTGLGLSISRELARLLGGTLEVTSKLGQGSVFTVTLPETFDPGLVAPRAARPASIPAPAALPAPGPTRARPAPTPPLSDDRDSLDQSRRVLLVVEDDQAFAGILKNLSHEMGFQVLLAGTAEEALSLARDLTPSAIILDVGLPDQSGLSVLDRLKRDVHTRHIPIHVVSAGDHAQTALSLGAVGYMLKPVRREQVAEVLAKLEARLEQRMHRVLIVEDDERQREAVSKLLASDDTETVAAGTAAECLELLRTQTFDCMVLDLSLPDTSGYALLETLSQQDAYSFPPVIVYTGRELSADDEMRLRRYSKSIIIKGAKSPERLLDEVTLFLHQVVAELPEQQQNMIRQARNRDALLEGRRILIVEDDVRNVYALTNILEPRGARVEIARNGKEALERLATSQLHRELAVDLVLMDVMMPVMDGLTATRAIRENPAWAKLPIIALTAKAMPDDQQRCIEAGASDYMAKPLDVEKLLSLVRVWMPK